MDVLRDCISAGNQNNQYRKLFSGLLATLGSVSSHLIFQVMLRDGITAKYFTNYRLLPKSAFALRFDLSTSRSKSAEGGPTDIFFNPARTLSVDTLLRRRLCGNSVWGRYKLTDVEANQHVAVWNLIEVEFLLEGSTNSSADYCLPAEAEWALLPVARRPAVATGRPLVWRGRGKESGGSQGHAARSELQLFCPYVQ